jgi:hypothetical protein
MTTSLTEIAVPAATNVLVTEDTLTVDLSDGRTIWVPLDWYPRLVHGTPEERSDWRLIGRGEGIHWPQLDDDISVEGLIAGKPSNESQRSLAAHPKRSPYGRTLHSDRDLPVCESLARLIRHTTDARICS